MDEGWLFLDSIDEARLRSPLDFEAAIRKVAHRLASAMERAHIVITGRPHAWRAKTDLALCERLLPTSSAMESVESTPDGAASGDVVRLRLKARREEPFTIVALNDLSPTQAVEFASARGVMDTTEFQNSLQRADGWSFTARPQDLEELVGFWMDKGRIGSRRDLIEASVQRRLTEHDPNRAEARPLTAKKVQTGARLVAAACTLTRLATVRVPDGSGSGVALGELLTDWDPKDQAELLARPIFDEALYGSVRFHHRSVREYLGALWLDGLLERQTSRRAIERLLFRNQYGMDVIVPETRPLLPWLSIVDHHICNRVLDLAPEVFFEGGDPSALPLEVRRRILRQVVSSCVEGTTSPVSINQVGLERFASAELTDEISELIAKHSENSDVLWLLLHMVWHGQLTGVVAQAKTIAQTSTAERYVRIAAFQAVDEVGSPSDMEDVRRTFLVEAAELDRAWLAELTSRLPPTDEAIAWLFEALAKAAPENPNITDDLGYALDSLIERVPQSALADFVSRLTVLLRTPPFIEHRHCEYSERFAWLLRCGGKAALRMINDRSPASLGQGALTILAAIPRASDFDHGGVGETKEQLSAAVADWPELKWALFWHLASIERSWLGEGNDEGLTSVRAVPLWSSFVTFGASDFDAAVQFAGTRPTLDDRLIAVTVAFDIYVATGRGATRRRQLRRKAAMEAELAERLSLLLRPPPQSAASLKLSKTTRNWARRDRERKLKTATREETNRQYIEAHLDEAVVAPSANLAGQVTSAQYYLLERARRAHDQNTSHYAVNIWRALIPEFGEPVAIGFRKAAVAFWRGFAPQLISEGAPQNSTPISVIFGLAGLSIEAGETEGWPMSLTEPEAEIAFRYAMRELNGFPPWLPKLYQRFPALIQRLVVHEIGYELGESSPDHESHYLLSDVAWSGQWLWDALGHELANGLARNEPQNLNDLRKVLAVVQGSSLADSELAGLAARKAQSGKERDRAALWFAAWVGVAPESAIPSLRDRLARIRKRSQAVRFAMIFVTQLEGGRTLRSATRGAYCTAETLKELYLLIRHYISEDEDIDRAGKGAYSPELRDDAQDARNSLFSRLRDQTGKAAFTNIVEIATNHPQRSFKAWALRLARAKAEADANGEPWSERQVREFNDTLERSPRNNRDLFELAVMRLEDIKFDLEEGDASEAQLWMRMPRETEVRNVLASRLRLTAKGRYSVVQEEEYSDAKRADLRFHAPGVDAPVPIELKLSRWPGATLFERLENQLCRGYLRDARSENGIFLVVHQGEGRPWTVPGGSQCGDFAGLVHALAGHWAALSSAFPDINEVKVVGIDLTKR